MTPTITLETERLILRPWNLSETDRSAFHFLMSDESVRQFYPTRKTRDEADKLLEGLVETYNSADLAWGAACLKTTGEPIGFTGLAEVKFDATFTPAVEIGWIYKPAFWKQGLASEAARALFKHGFDDLGLNEIVAFTARINTPSSAVMRSLGMERNAENDFDHPMVTDDAAHLRPHIVYRLNRQQWHKQKGR